MTKREFDEVLDDMMYSDFGIINGLSTYGEVYEMWDEFIAFCKQFKPQARAHFRQHGTLNNLVYKDTARP